LFGSFGGIYFPADTGAVSLHRRDGRVKVVGGNRDRKPLAVSPALAILWAGRLRGGYLCGGR